MSEPLTAREALQLNAVRSLHSTIAVAEMAILHWVLLAETIGVPPSTVAGARSLAQALETWVRFHPVASVESLPSNR
jgi:hypothetical protein